MIGPIEIAEIPLKVGNEIKNKKIRVMFEWVLVKVISVEETMSAGGIVLGGLNDKQLESVEKGYVMAIGKLAEDYLIEEYEENILEKGQLIYIKKNTGISLDVLGGIKMTSAEKNINYRYVPIKEILFPVLNDEA